MLKLQTLFSKQRELETLIRTYKSQIDTLYTLNRSHLVEIFKLQANIHDLEIELNTINWILTGSK